MKHLSLEIIKSFHWTPLALQYVNRNQKDYSHAVKKYESTYYCQLWPILLVKQI